jgi:predicted TIM-barrel fold metal-dependent hydrolase
MKKIDFRVRPPYGHYLKFYEDLDDLEVSSWGHTKTHLAPSVRERSVDLLIQEMDEAGIEAAVVPGRVDFGVTNEELFALSHQYPGRFYIFPSVDPLSGQAALEQVEKYVIHGEGRGIAIEPGFTPETYFTFDDERLFPLYSLLEAHDIPLMINYSAHSMHGMPMDTQSPTRLDRASRLYPKLNFIAAHGGWPWTKECIALAMYRPNIYLLPDAYSLIAPGAEDYWIAARKLAKGKILFGSAHPLAPSQAAAHFVEREWGLDEAEQNEVFYQVAAKLLKLDGQD